VLENTKGYLPMALVLKRTFNLHNRIKEKVAIKAQAIAIIDNIFIILIISSSF